MNEIKTRLINVLFDNILRGSTVCGIGLFACKILYPQYFATLTEIVATYLVTKKG